MSAYTKQQRIFLATPSPSPLARGSEGTRHVAHVHKNEFAAAKRNDETRRKLDAILKAERWLDIKTWIAAVSGGLLLIAVLFYPGENIGRTTGVVRWSEIVIDADTGRSYSSLIAELPDGRRVNASAAYKPPPVPGSTVALQVRRTWYGYTYYSWLWAEPAR